MSMRRCADGGRADDGHAQMRGRWTHRRWARADTQPLRQWACADSGHALTLGMCGRWARADEQMVDTQTVGTCRHADAQTVGMRRQWARADAQTCRWWTRRRWACAYGGHAQTLARRGPWACVSLSSVVCAGPASGKTLLRASGLGVALSTGSNRSLVSGLKTTFADLGLIRVLQWFTCHGARSSAFQMKGGEENFS